MKMFLKGADGCDECWGEGGGLGGEIVKSCTLKVVQYYEGLEVMVSKTDL